MLKVKNKQAVHRLADKNYRSNKRRNKTAICAILLTTLLFAVIFTIGISMVKSMELNSMRMSGGMAHGTFKYLSEEQYAKIKDHPSIKRIGTSHLVGFAKSDALIKRPVEIDSADKDLLDMSFISIKEGSLPVKADEIVLDTVTLDLLGLPHKVGEKVVLSIDLGDRMADFTFVLSGYYEGDAAFMGAIGIASEEFINQELAGRGQKYYKDGDMYGSIRADVMFGNSNNIQQKMEKILTDGGLKPESEEENPDENTVAFGVNWAYMNASINSESLGAAAVIFFASLLIGVTGYLIIYNIFQISVIRDIRFYGLLKTIGTTGKQIRSILIRQALAMCLIGIPIGLIAGYGMGCLLLPFLTKLLYGGQNFISINPVIFIGSALFSLVTVLLSCAKPAKTASRISPVEAVKYNGMDKSYHRKNKRSTNGAKLYKMAFSNLGRNRKRTMITVISMSLSLILMNTLLTLSHSIDMDAFVKKFIDVDFQVAHASYFNYEYKGTGDDSVSSNLVAAMKEQDGFLDGGGIYTFRGPGFSAEYIGELKSSWTDITTEYNETNGLWTRIYGMDDFCLSNLDIVKGTLDLDKLKSGKGILLGLKDDDYGEFDYTDAIYEIGEKVKLKELVELDEEEYIYNEAGEVIDKVNKTGYGDSREYEVIGYYRLGQTNTDRTYGYAAVFAMAAEEMRNLESDLSLMTYLCEAKDEAGASGIENMLASYTEKTEPLMSYVSRKTYQEQFMGMQTMILTVGGALCFVVGMIGILNFINAISTSILSRQQEFAVLKSIGMTNGQLKKMLILEGIYYTGFTMCVSLIGSILFSYGVLSHMDEILWMLVFRPTFVVFLPTFPILLILSILVPYIFYHSTAKESIVQMLKREE